MCTLLLLLMAAFLAIDPATYVGSWNSAVNNGTGMLQLVIGGSGDDSKCEFSFKLPDSGMVKGETVSCKIGEATIQSEYKFEAQGYQLHTRFAGKLEGASAAGSYETFGPDDAKVDSGTWKAKQK